MENLKAKLGRINQRFDEKRPMLGDTTWCAAEFDELKAIESHIDTTIATSVAARAANSAPVEETPVPEQTPQNEEGVAAGTEPVVETPAEEEKTKK